MKDRRILPARSHAVFQLAPGLLLVFKPRGHCEGAHAHPYRQRLRVLRGQLSVRIGEQRVVLRPSSPPFTLAADRIHETHAVEGTWLTAEVLSPRKRPSASRR